MKRLLLLFAVLVLAAGCATVRKVESGTNTVGERLSIEIEGNWNHLDFPGIKPAQVWTMEGLAVDELMIYAGIRDGEAMHPASTGGKKKDFVFRSGMQTEEVVALFEGVLSRDDSTFKLLSLKPYAFGGKRGFRFDYQRIRKLDNVQLRGIGFGAVHDGQLFALLYHAPRLTFFPRHQARVEAIANSAVIR
jgi:hypothetical protein